jgi:hypothetical protein
MRPNSIGVSEKNFRTPKICPSFSQFPLFLSSRILFLSPALSWAAMHLSYGAMRAVVPFAVLPEAGDSLLNANTDSSKQAGL